MANPAARLAHSISSGLQSSDGEAIADLLSLKKPSANQIVHSLPPGWSEVRPCPISLPLTKSSRIQCRLFTHTQAVNKILNKKQPWGEIVRQFLHHSSQWQPRITWMPAGLISEHRLVVIQVCSHVEALLYNIKSPSTLDFEAAQAAQSQTLQAYEAQTKVAA